METYNFGAGPAMLPKSILKEAQAQLLSWKKPGVSILETGHRTPEFMQLLSQAEQNLRILLAIPENYQVLFLGGAARLQFAMIPLNFLSYDEEAAYLITGIWSKMAFEEAKHLKKAYCLADEALHGFTTVPEPTSWKLNKNTAYLYYTPNETVNGVRFSYVPKAYDVPLIADMTSCLLSEPIDVEQYGLIFAGAQKNIANAGLTIVIIRDDLLEKNTKSTLPTMLDYKVHAKSHSLYATPPVFNCYLADKMFAWVKEQGGVEALFHKNRLKAAKLYSYIDSSDFYTSTVVPQARSLMNVCFTLKNPTLESHFVALAEKQGLYALKGHRYVGGLRASLYNAMPMAGVDALIHFMSEFAKGK